MTRGQRALTWITLGLSISATLFAEGDTTAEEALWHHRNLGKAFYENPATQYEAVGEFEKALALRPGSARERVNYGLALLRAGKETEGIAELEKAQKQDPSIPHTWFNLGIAYKRASQYDQARVQFERMVELAPEDPIAHYNLGVLYKLDQQTEKAVHHFERSAELDPNLAGPHFQLATAYRQAKRAEDSKREMKTFRELKARDAGAAVPEDLEWSFYAEIYETIEPVSGPAAPGTVHFETIELGRGLDAASAGLLRLDLDGDLGIDLAAFSKRGVTLFRDGVTAVPNEALATLTNIVDVASSDVDNDGRADLVVLHENGAVLWRNGEGGLESAGTLVSGTYRRLVWLDYDHDYDQDLLLLGKASKLLRNNGPEAGFADHTEDFPFEAGDAIDAARVDVIADTQGADLAVLYADRPAVLYRDRLGGRYEPRPLPGVPGDARAILSLDVDNDGWTDLVALGAEPAVLRNDHTGGFSRVLGFGRQASGIAHAVAADLENRSVSDLVSGSGLFRNRGSGRYTAQDAPSGLAGATAVAAADFDADGRIDMAAVGSDGVLRQLRNRTEGEHRWLRIGVVGVKNPKLAPGAEVEVKAGRRYQKKVYDGTPLHFGLARDQQVDTVRITWPNGLIQNESQQDAAQDLVYQEAQRLSGSCPMIFTWNGREFEFITDVLGVAPLGASAGDGSYFPVDHDEVIQIDGDSLVPHEDGTYEIRITEELREIAYLDQIRLIAVDHPRAIEVVTNDKFKGPPFPEFRLFGIEQRFAPRAVRDHRGQDVRALVLERDQRYPDAFERDYAGVAELHHLELDFDAQAIALDRSVLVLSGWVDWADGSTFLGAAQGGQGLIMPHLQVQEADGSWRTIVEDMGLPAGKPKTIAVDLTGLLPADARALRIVTNLCVYWDEIYLARAQAPADTTLTYLDPLEADLRFRGFSGVVVHPERKQPERFVYAELRPLSMWNPTPGLYTRYGDVRPLLGEIDDRFVIMGSGDELRLLFDATALPAVPPGHERNYLLFVDGWAKDGDANTAHSQTVGPLPYHDMPQYPYADPHAYPGDAGSGAHRRYDEHYNRRPALRLIRPLTEETGAARTERRR